MIKSTKRESRPPHEANSRKPVCWNEDTHAQSLRVELGDDIFFVFPYIHLASAKVEREKTKDVLTISFTTHDVRVVGRNLREVGMALQKLAVDWISQTPVRYAPLSPKDSVFIDSIEVKEASGDAAEFVANSTEPN